LNVINNFRAITDKGNKVKCYVNKGKPNQRIRKISTFGINSVTHLKRYLRSEFGWDESKQFEISYASTTSDSTIITTITEDEKWKLISPNVAYFVLNTIE
jgi:hypothetical protein